MKGQVYNIKHTGKAGLAKPAQFVFENNDSNEIIGFIFSVSEDNYITIAFSKNYGIRKIMKSYKGLRRI